MLIDLKNTIWFTGLVFVWICSKVQTIRWADALFFIFKNIYIKLKQDKRSKWRQFANVSVSIGIASKMPEHS